MGTLVGVTLYARSAAEARAGFSAAYGRIAALNAMLSDYLADSEVSLLGVTPRRVSAELYRVLQFARGVSEASGGAFDVTVGPLTRLWRQRLPLSAEVRELVNWRELHLEGGLVWLGRAGMRVDLGAIGKGFAADEALRVLRGMGLSRALVAASGDIVCGDAPPGRGGGRCRRGGGWCCGGRRCRRRGIVRSFLSRRGGGIRTFWTRGGGSVERCGGGIGGGEGRYDGGCVGDDGEGDGGGGGWSGVGAVSGIGRRPKVIVCDTVSGGGG